MIKHIVFFKFKDFAEGENKTTNMAKAKVMLDGLVGRVPSLLSMCAGPGVPGSASDWDFALITEFDSPEALQQYTNHPEHKKVSDFISKVRAERAFVDFTF
jgi:hypothetical protein